MLLAQIFLQTAAAPALVVAILFWLFGSAPEPWRARIQSLVFAGGFAVSCCLLSGSPPWPPTGGAPSLLYVAIWFALFPWIAPQGSSLRYILRGLWVFGGAVLAIWSLRESILTSQVQSRNILAFILLGWGMWSISERSVRKSPFLTPLALTCVSFTAASLLMVFESSMLISQLLTSAAVMIGAVAALSWLAPKRVSLHAIFPFCAGFFAVFLIVGYAFVDIDPWTCISMAIPFGVLMLKDLIGFRLKGALADAASMVIISAIPLGIILYKIFLNAGPLY